MADRRELDIARLDQVMPEVDRLLAGYVALGKWSLGQMCNHLATAFRYSATATALPPEPTPQQTAIRARFFSARFPEGRNAPPGLDPQAGLDDRQEADALRGAIEKFSSATGPCAPHPMLGPLTHDEWARFHCMHAEHHLGFIVPK